MAHTQEYPDAFPLTAEDEHYGDVWWKLVNIAVDKRRAMAERHGHFYDVGLPCINDAIYDANKMAPRDHDYTLVAFAEWDRTYEVWIPPGVRVA